MSRERLELELKPIDATYLPQALEKAERYRLLNWPHEAQSICLDILAADPDHPKAKVVLVLALADQILEEGGAAAVHKAKQWLAKVGDEYQRAYLTGVIYEREARAHLRRGFDASFAYESFRDAMQWYDKAAALQPPGLQEAALRYNSCVRTIQEHKLAPRRDDPVTMLE